MRIRPYRKDDYESLVTTIDSVCAEGKWMHTTRFVSTPAWSQILDNPASAKNILLIAEIRGRLVGWNRIFRDNRDSHQAEIGIGVAQPYRNQDIGRQLLQVAQQWAAVQQINQLHLSTRVDNERAIHLFQKMGFFINKRLSNSYLSMRTARINVSHFQEVRS